MFDERIKGLKFLFSIPLVKVFMITTVVLSTLMTAFKNTPQASLIAGLNMIFFVLLINYYVISSLVGRIKGHWGLKKRFFISLVLAPVLANLLQGVYAAVFIVGFVSWVFIESYSFVAFSWDVTGKLKLALIGIFFSGLIVLSYGAYIGAMYARAQNLAKNPEEGIITNGTVTTFDLILSMFIFLYAFSKMGSRFVKSKRASPELLATFVMIMTIGYVLASQGPNPVGQVIYYGTKLFLLGVSVPLLFVVRSLKLGKRFAKWVF